MEDVNVFKIIDDDEVTNFFALLLRVKLSEMTL